MRNYFQDLYSMLHAREQQIQQQLYDEMQNISHPLKIVSCHLKEAVADVNYHLSEANEMVQKSKCAEIKLWTDTLRRLQPYPHALEAAVGRLNPNQFLVDLEPQSEFISHFKEDAVMNVEFQFPFIKDQGWPEIEKNLADLKRTKNTIVKSSYPLNAVNFTPSPLKDFLSRLAEHPIREPVESPIISQAMNYEEGVQMTSVVKHIDLTDHFYIQIQPLVELKWHVEIPLDDSNAVNSLNQLKRGQLVAVKRGTEWNRALIEEINFRCCDVFVFFVDSGARELITQLEDIRLLSQKKFLSEPAQAVCCVFSDSTFRRHLVLGRQLDLTVQRIENGQVGRLDCAELVLWVEL